MRYGANDLAAKICRPCKHLCQCLTDETLVQHSSEALAQQVRRGHACCCDIPRRVEVAVALMVTHAGCDRGLHQHVPLRVQSVPIVGGVNVLVDTAM